eukprot:TRINITY_DN172_c0_g2_i1.p2 TRINITY_DN172_c0_g2~~TRINITY_DN172_c0_g2_i1.p2  ORF type:complete len:129 (+),score=32.66 TRINITY_DN172_c0_g2_i1:2337-2723(+)
MSNKQVITSPAAPPAIGPYSQAVKANGFVFVSGCIGMNVQGELVGETLDSQARKALDNIKHILEAAGCTLADVVKTTVLLKDMALYSEFNAIYAEYFATSAPARAAYAVAGLPRNALVEIEAVAVVPH